jgi:hypothetical protein
MVCLQLVCVSIAGAVVRYGFANAPGENQCIFSQWAMLATCCAGGDRAPRTPPAQGDRGGVFRPG